MKIVAIVPVKLNNERLPNKNIKPFEQGEPLSFYIFNTLLQVEGIDEVYVYCSSPKIKNFVPTEIKFLQRSESLDQNTTKINEVLSAFANDVDADIYVMTHVTSPFITISSIEKGLAAVKSGNYDSAFAVKKIQSFLWKDNEPFNYSLDNIPRTQDIKPIFEETSGFYIYKKHIIKDLNRRIGEKPFLVEVSAVESTDIDEQEDFDIANAIYKHLIKKRNENN